MKQTGIVRRIDDLGRIIIPKEIRRSLRISEGDPLELWIDGDSIVVTKYKHTLHMSEAINRLKESLKDDFNNCKYKNELLNLVSVMEELIKVENSSVSTDQ